MTSHLGIILSVIQNDTEDPHKQSDQLEALYNIATDTQKKAIDNALICICGYSLDTIINNPEKISMDDEE